MHNWERNNPCYCNINIGIMTKKEMHKGGVTETLNSADDADKAFWDQLAELAKGTSL